MSCGVGGRFGLDLELRGLGGRQETEPQVRPQERKLPYAAGVDKKKKKKKKKDKIQIRKIEKTD